MVARIFRNTGYLLGGKGMAGVLGFLTTALVVRALGLEGYGTLLLMHACASSFSVGTRFQSWQPLLHFGNTLFGRGEQPRFQALLRHCMMLDALGAVAGTILAVAAIMTFGRVFGWPASAQGPALVYMSSVLFMNTCWALGVLRLTDRFRQSALADLAINSTRLVGTLLGMGLHWHLGGFMVVWYLGTVMSFTANCSMAWRAIRHTPSLQGFRLAGPVWHTGFPGIWRLTLSTSGNQALAALTSRVTVLLVGAATSPAAAAVYSVTWHVCDALAQPAQLLTPALYPELIRLRDQGDRAGMRRVMFRIFQALGLFSVLALLVAATIGPWVFQTLLAVRTDNLALLMLLTSAAILDLWDVPLEPFLVSLGYAHRLLTGRIAATTFCLPVLYGLARVWSVNGAGLATLLVEALILSTRVVPFLRLRRL
nr:lipopolysaccharide biosynthesis protein [Gluconacetobacter takamatsuzukensis]